MIAFASACAVLVSTLSRATVSRSLARSTASARWRADRVQQWLLAWESSPTGGGRLQQAVATILFACDAVLTQLDQVCEQRIFGNWMQERWRVIVHRLHQLGGRTTGQVSQATADFVFALESVTDGLLYRLVGLVNQVAMPGGDHVQVILQELLE